jgi:hypothetical protein
MPRKRNPAGIATGKLILAIRKECGEGVGGPDAVLAQQVLDRAHTLLQASQISSVSNFLDGRSIVEYLGPVWVEMHPAVGPAIAALVEALTENPSHS